MLSAFNCDRGRALESRLFATLLMCLAPCQQLLEIDALKGLARFTQREFEEARRDFGRKRGFGAAASPEPLHQIDVTSPRRSTRLFRRGQMVEIAGPERVGERGQRGG